MRMIRAGSHLTVPTTCMAALVLVGVAGCGANAGTEGTTGAGSTPSLPATSIGAGGSADPGSFGGTATAPAAESGGSTAGVATPPPSVGPGGVPVPNAGAPAGAGGTAVDPGTPAGAGGAADPGTPAGTGGAGAQPPGCAQGTFCQAADDLAPPDASQGFQLVSPESIIIDPGAEGFYCYYKNAPASSNAAIGGFRSWMTKGSSHHFITYLVGSSGLLSTKQADGTLQQCGFGAGQWIYATSQPGLVVGMDMPATVGLPLPTGSQLMMNMHFINTGDSPTHPVVKLNVLYANDIKYTAAAMVSFNTQINVPAHGSQTVRGSCTVPAGSNFFVMSTHTHRWATAADVNYVSGGQTTNIVHSTDYENPGTHVWEAPNFLTTKAGDSFTYSCDYQNNDSFAVTVGETASRNEMCMAIGYFFPAGNATCL